MKLKPLSENESRFTREFNDREDYLESQEWFQPITEEELTAMEERAGKKEK